MGAAARGRSDIQAEYLTPEQVAKLTGFSPKSLESRRYKGTGPKCHRIGRRVRYHIDDVRAWIESGGAPR